LGKLGAILLVGGFGTRLHPLTLDTPKPFLHVAGVPFIDHQIHQAVAAGVSEIVLATSFKSEIFIPYCGDGSRYKTSIKYAVEEVALGTGGAIRNAAKLLSPDIENVVIFNGDVLSGFTLRDEVDFHQQNKAWATLYLTTVSDARPFGVVELNENNSILSFREKMENPPTNVINAGCYIFSRELIDHIENNYEDGKVISVEREIFPQLLTDEKPLFGFVDNSYWLDMGTPENFRKASVDLITGVAFSPATPSNNGEVVMGENCTVSQSAELTEGTSLANNVVVGDGAKVSATIVGEGASIGARSIIKNSIINKGAIIPDGFILDSAIFGF
jgi:mannose-1-phosphate guanylyltransferase